MFLVTVSGKYENYGFEYAGKAECGIQ